jgi:hypothetical protein
MTAAWPEAACGYLTKALAAALVITGLSVAGVSTAPAGAQAISATSTSSTNGSLTMWCTTSNSYVHPGLLDLLAVQYQSGPVETVTCVPAAVGRDGGLTVLSQCSVSNTYTNPGVLDLLAPQVQSGPAQTMTCVPAAGGAGGVVVLSACTVSNGYTNPGLLGLLAPQFQSGPVQTVSCIPVAVVAEHATGSHPGNAVISGASRGNASDPSATAQSLGASVTGQSALAATGPTGSLLAVRWLAGLLIALGVLGLRVARATTMSPALRETDAAVLERTTALAALIANQQRSSVDPRPNHGSARLPASPLVPVHVRRR